MNKNRDVWEFFQSTIFSVITIAYRGFALMVLWNGFLATGMGFPEFNFKVAVGTIIIITFVFGSGKSSENTKLTELFWGSIAYTTYMLVFGGLLLLIF